MNDLTPERLSWAMGDRRYEYHPTIGSTNDRAMALLREGAPSGMVVLADEQTAGRGRLGRSWHSPTGSALMLSVILRPAASAQSRIGMLGALMVCDAVEASGVEQTGIKWPNDVQIDGRKVCGILPEADWQGETLTGVVLGMGINVRVNFAGSPLEGAAISLSEVVSDIDRAALLRSLLERLDFWTPQLGSDALFAAWERRLNMIGKTVSIAAQGESLHGKAIGVDRDGALRIRGQDGAVRRAVAGDLALG
ncbi:MAG: biotin--[acetyl-CoA-carboxylase] ligase [Chloroflexi bacterium]|nr:biotin--[acetyl-CoA-carboxylase] ligase [Chloroflexota bacterium]